MSAIMGLKPIEDEIYSLQSPLTRKQTSELIYDYCYYDIYEYLKALIEHHTEVDEVQFWILKEIVNFNSSNRIVNDFHNEYGDNLGAVIFQIELPITGDEELDEMRKQYAIFME